MTKDSGQFRFEYLDQKKTERLLSVCPPIVRATIREMMSSHSNFVVRGSERQWVDAPINSRVRREIELFRVNNLLSLPVDRLIISYFESEAGCVDTTSSDESPNCYATTLAFLSAELDKFRTSAYQSANDFVNKRRLVSQVATLISQFSLQVRSFEIVASNQLLILDRVAKAGKYTDTDMRIIISGSTAPGIACGINDYLPPR